LFSRWPVRRRALVNLTSGAAFDAVLWAKRGPLLVLRDVTLLEPDAEPATLDGEIVVERDRVSFIQVR
jgi:hypothetical protein